MFDPSLTAFDAAALFVVGVSVLVALARGAVHEVLTLAVWIIAIVIAYTTFETVRPLVLETFPNEWVADGVTFALAFLAPLVVLKVVVAFTTGLVPLRIFGVVDRILGAAFGLVRGAALVAAAYLGLTTLISPPNQPSWIQQAVLLPYVANGAALLVTWLPTTVLPEDLAERADWSGEGGAATEPVLSGGVGGPREPWPAP